VYNEDSISSLASN